MFFVYDTLFEYGNNSISFLPLQTGNGEMAGKKRRKSVRGKKSALKIPAGKVYFIAENRCGAFPRPYEKRFPQEIRRTA